MIFLSEIQAMDLTYVITIKYRESVCLISSLMISKERD